MSLAGASWICRDLLGCNILIFYWGPIAVPEFFDNENRKTSEKKHPETNSQRPLKMEARFRFIRFIFSILGRFSGSVLDSGRICHENLCFFPKKRQFPLHFATSSGHFVVVFHRFLYYSLDFLVVLANKICAFFCEAPLTNKCWTHKQ